MTDAKPRFGPLEICPVCTGYGVITQEENWSGTHFDKLVTCHLCQGRGRRRPRLPTKLPMTDAELIAEGRALQRQYTALRQAYGSGLRVFYAGNELQAWGGLNVDRLLDLAADAEKAERERETFYMDYRMKADRETKQAQVERDAAIARATENEAWKTWANEVALPALQAVIDAARKP